MRDTSTYRKVKDILAAASSHSGNVGELADKLYERCQSFYYSKRNEDGEVNSFPCNKSTIRAMIRFCIDLKLLEGEERCSLTDNGKNARLKDKFDYQLQQSVIRFLEDKRLPFDKIEKALDTLPFPHLDALYQYLKPDIAPDEFRKCLFLLSRCGEKDDDNLIKPFSKKLYLTEARKKKVFPKVKK